MAVGEDPSCSYAQHVLQVRGRGLQGGHRRRRRRRRSWRGKRPQERHGGLHHYANGGSRYVSSNNLK